MSGACDHIDGSYTINIFSFVCVRACVCMYVRAFMLVCMCVSGCTLVDG